MRDVESQLEGLVNMVNSFADYFGSLQDQALALAQARVNFQEIVTPQTTQVLESLVADRHGLHPEETHAVHYTSLTSLFGMFNTGGLRLYDSHFLNDSSEGKFFDENSGLAQNYAWLDTDSNAPAYISSFVVADSNGDRRNELRFWQTYGDNGRGCSIEMLTESCGFKKILYGKDEALATVECLKPVLECLEPLTHKTAPYGDLFVQAVRDALTPLRYLYKSQDFSDEDECRQVVLPQHLTPKQVHFDTLRAPSSGVQVRHFCYDERLRLARVLGKTGAVITLGPAVTERSKTEYAIRAGLRKHGLRGTAIEYSEISYRPS